MDHKNLQYLREAKRLNPRQARWVLFLTRFNFKIIYCPGSKNVKTDALSHQFSVASPVEPEPIIPPDVIVSPIICNMDKNIHNPTLQEPAPLECPEGKIYVPNSQRQELLAAAHESLGSGHPDSRRTLLLLQARYWWPSTHLDITRYVQSCSVCAMSNTPRQLPAGKLVPLPISQRPWSHNGVDFITDLPNSEGNSCILVTVDRFFQTMQACSIKGTTYSSGNSRTTVPTCLPQLWLEIVSDRGPQFISHVWKAFFKLLGISVNLSSVYDPQTNSQTERKIQELGRYLW
ncbi:Transposon Tf2-9 polyprotein [Labeo rohita]|uniref:Gypsy retrotransposon integrase-like protein 1 n=1 Tax=Labeo rohita TaxID=84645 RepID=A0ABQ8MDX0_LABRO|nr:Transposon Tf2-9 polyprotein [Labeo rohita]